MPDRIPSPFAERVGRPEPTVATVIAAEPSPSLLADIASIEGVAEVRVDLLKDQRLGHLKNFIARMAEMMPTLVTIRPNFEGGRWPDSEWNRGHYIRLLSPDAHAVDIELAAPFASLYRDHIRESDASLIVSHHDFKGVPSIGHMEDMLGRARTELGADYFKFAGRIVSLPEYDRLSEFTELHGGPQAETGLITVGMAIPDDTVSVRLAERSRVELPELGSLLTYAHDGREAVVPGQLSYVETHERLLMRNAGYAQLFSEW